MRRRQRAALRASHDRLDEELNLERQHRGEPPIQLSLGLHYGPVVLGDIGLNRLEFAVIGTTVNAASRLEALTPRIRMRDGGQPRSGATGARRGRKCENADFMHLVEKPACAVRGIEQPVAIWTRANNA